MSVMQDQAHTIYNDPVIHEKLVILADALEAQAEVLETSNRERLATFQASMDSLRASASSLRSWGAGQTEQTFIQPAPAGAFGS